MVSSGLLRRVALVRTDVSEEPSASFIRVIKIGALGTTQAATSNRRTRTRTRTRNGPELSDPQTPIPFLSADGNLTGQDVLQVSPHN
jgi:hypothetical protein